MKPVDQIKAIAELDGWTVKKCSCGCNEWVIDHNEGRGVNDSNPLPDYLNSRDAIIPVIEKQPFDVKVSFIHALYPITDTEATESSSMSDLRLVCATPAQLCEALLRATGKWIE